MPSLSRGGVSDSPVPRIMSPLPIYSRGTRRLDSTILFLGSGCLVCLTPLAVYLLYLAHLNSRTPPTLIPGPWDFGAVLLGLAGFIVLGGPTLLTLVDSTWRSYAFGNWSELKGVGEREARKWSLMATGYFLILAGVVPLLLRSRRPITAVYNVAAAMAEVRLLEVLEELGHPWRRLGGSIEIGPKRDGAGGPVAVRIEAFPSTAHATLRWSDPWSSVRADVEAALPAALARGGLARNPAAGWLYTAAVAVLVIMLILMAAMILLMMGGGRS